jgi:hypothetical protein
MTDLLATVKHVRNVIQKLSECKDAISNKQKKAEIERLILELRLHEDSLLVKDPLTNSLSRLSVRDTVAPPSLPSQPLNMNQFRIYAEQQKLNSFPEIKQAALKQGLNPLEATNSVLKMQQSRRRAEVEALAANMLPDIRSRLYGRNFSARELQAEVKRIVQASNVVNTDLVDSVTELILQQIS